MNDQVLTAGEVNNQVLTATEAVFEGDESEYSDSVSEIDWEEIDRQYEEQRPVMGLSYQDFLKTVPRLNEYQCDEDSDSDSDY